MAAQGQKRKTTGSGKGKGRKHAPEAKCPIPEAHDAYDEAHYFIHEVMKEYHEPEPFRWSLNAFLQALRNVTFRLQAELDGQPWFQQWYEQKRDAMRKDQLLRATLEGRNLVAKRRNLILNSTAQIGMFRRRGLKLAFGGPISPEFPSKYVLKHIAPKLNIIDKRHTAIDEEYGVRREWFAPDLGNGEVLGLCDTAWARIGVVVSEAHRKLGFKYEAPPEHAHDLESCNLLTETDVDPNLRKKWGWDE